MRRRRRASSSEYEHSRITARFRDGKRRATRGLLGRSPHKQAIFRGEAPYGLYLPVVADILAGTFPPELLGRHVIVFGDEEQAQRLERVRAMFENFYAGIAMTRIAAQLTEEGVPSSKGLPYWHDRVVAYILSNEAYKGTPMHYKRRKRSDEVRQLERGNKCEWVVTNMPRDEWEELDPPVIFFPENRTWEIAEPVVPPALWDAVAERRKSKGYGSCEAKSMCVGVMRCPCCGGPMIGKRAPSSGTMYYRCSGFKAKDGKRVTPCSGLPYLPQQEVDETIARLLANLAECPALVEQAISEYERSFYQGDSVGLEIARREQRVAEIDKKIVVTTRMEMEAFTSEQPVKAEACKDILSQLETERKKIVAQLTELRQRAGHAPAEPPRTRAARIAAAAEDIYEALSSDQINGARKNELLKKFVSKITIEQDGGKTYLVVHVKGMTCVADGVITLSALFSAKKLTGHFERGGKGVTAKAQTMKSYISRKLPLETRTTDQSFECRSVRILKGVAASFGEFPTI